MSRVLGRGTTSAKPPEVVASVVAAYVATDSAGYRPSPRLPSHETNFVPLFQAHQTMSYPHFQPRLAEAPGSQIAHLCLPRRFIPSNEHDKRFLIFYFAKLNTNPTFILYLVPPRCQHSPIPVAFGTTPTGIRYPHASEPHVEAAPCLALWRHFLGLDLIFGCIQSTCNGEKTQLLHGSSHCHI